MTTRWPYVVALTFLVVLGLTTAAQTPCAASATTLCIDDAAGDRRFAVTIDYATAQGGGLTGPGHAIPTASIGLTRGGLFWFFDGSNPELLVKVLNGCSVNGRYWLFASAGTNVGLSLRVTDTSSGMVKTYANTDLTPFVPIQDTAFLPCNPGLSAAGAWAEPEGWQRPPRLFPAIRPVLQTYVEPGVCVPGPTTLCIDGAPGDRRFRVEVAWQTAQAGGLSGLGGAIPTAPLGLSRGGLFWFFGADNPEILVKALDGCGVTNRRWFFASAGTNVAYTITVTDMQTGEQQRYTNADLHAAEPVQDTGAFGCANPCAGQTAVVAGSSGAACTGGSLVLTATPVPNAAYSWTGPNGFVSSQQNPALSGLTGAASGVYTVVATAGVCVSTSSVTVAVSQPPDAAITAPSVVEADSAGNEAEVPDAGPGATYVWTITGGSLTSGAGTRRITFAADVVGTVSLGVTVQTGAGCQGTDTANVAITCTPPTATITPAGPTTFCQGGSVQLQGPAGMSAYNWFMNGVPVASTQNVTVNQAASYTLQVTNASGCDDLSDPVVVTVNPNVSGSISASPTTINFFESSNLTVTVANATSWSLSSALGNSFSQGGGSTNGTFSVSYLADNNTGSDTVTLTINGDCGSPITRTVNIQVN